MDIYWRDQMVCPTEDQYLDMIVKKTGGPFILAVKLMQLFSSNKTDFQPLLKILSHYFQIRDDYANLMSVEYNEKKGFCEDITEGKFSFPIIHAMNNSINDTTIIDILRLRTRDNGLKKMVIKKLQSLGSLEYTLERIIMLDSMARNEINVLGHNPVMMALLDYLRNI
ncbi:unnamed protein product, partial [Medioppia subpectinata]